MYWSRFFYWLFRWTFAVPLFLLLVIVGAGILAFNYAFGVDDGFDRTAIEWLSAKWNWCFIKRNDR